MKHGLGLLFGAGMLVAAFLLASSTTSQDSAPRPQVALAVATALHETPPPTPLPTATPPRLTHVGPSGQELLDVLFHETYYGAFLKADPDRVQVVPFSPWRAPYVDLAVVGDGGIAANGWHSAPIAFGAILFWNRGEYVVKDMRLYFGDIDANARAEVKLATSQVRFEFWSSGTSGLTTRSRVVELDCSADECRTLKDTIMSGGGVSQ